MPAETKDTEITIKWNEPQNNGAPITQYTLYQRTVTDDGKPREWNKMKVIDDASVREVAVKLEKGKMYEFVVTARNSFGESLKEEGKIMKITVLGGRCMSFFSLGGGGVEIVIHLYISASVHQYLSNLTTVYSDVHLRTSIAV